MLRQTLKKRKPAGKKTKGLERRSQRGGGIVVVWVNGVWERGNFWR